jgi:hypothetical protein
MMQLRHCQFVDGSFECLLKAEKNTKQRGFSRVISFKQETCFYFLFFLNVTREYLIGDYDKVEKSIEEFRLNSYSLLTEITREFILGLFICLFVCLFVCFSAKIT